MRNEIEDWVVKEAKYIIDNKSTMRETGKVFGVSKSAIHRDMRLKLPMINYSLYQQVAKIIEFNSLQKHLRGGEATKRKYKEEKLNV